MNEQGQLPEHRRLARMQQIEKLERKLSRMKKLGIHRITLRKIEEYQQKLADLQAILHDPQDARQRGRVKRNSPYRTFHNPTRVVHMDRESIHGLWH